MNKPIMALLVDDDPINNFLSKAVLTRTGIVEEIHEEINGKNGLIFLQKYYAVHRYLPELILLDLNMPIMNGFEFLKEFNNEFHLLKEKVKIVILSASMSEREKAEALALGVHHFIDKPLSEEALSKLINEVFRFSLGSN